MLNSYKQLIVWQKSFRLSLKVFSITENFPKSEVYGLSSQMRRAGVSIPSNIAEGYARGHKAEYIQFLRTSYGSVAELDTQLLIAKELGYIGLTDYKQISGLIEEVSKMLNSLISKLNPRP